MINQLHCRDSRDLSFIPNDSVDLIITSPPYFDAGKTHNDSGMTLLEYMVMLEKVWEECVRVLKVGGRICINVANVGRRPYIPLEAFITQQMLDLGLIMRGQIIWDKGASVGVSTAWGSFCKPSNPYLRDVHEYILIFSKDELALQHKGESDLTSEEFVAYTKSVWLMPTVSAKRIGHATPFPLELPYRLIKLYSYKDDLVLDPFAGSGTTCLAAQMLGRRWIGVDMDSTSIRLAEGYLSGQVKYPYEK